MATNMFITIGDIRGDSRDRMHRDEVEVLSWSCGLSNSVAAPSGGAAVGKANFQDVTFTHVVDRASPNLMLACAAGKRFKDARLTVRRAGPERPQDFLVITLQDVSVTSVQCTGSGPESTLAEQVGLTFASVDFEYKPQKDDGSIDDGVHFRWDLQNHSPF